MPAESNQLTQPIETGNLDDLANVAPRSMPRNRGRARRRANAVLEGGALGVHVVRQSGTAELGDYDEPVILMSLGEVPQTD